MKGWKANRRKAQARRRSARHHRPPAGSRPGTLATPTAGESSQVRAVRYTPESVSEKVIRDARELAGFCAPGGILWIDVQGLGDRVALESIAQHFGLHPLVLADIVNVPQRPKCEAYENVLFVVTRRIRWRGEPGARLEHRQVSLVLAPGAVLTFQECADPVFDPVRTRIGQAGAQLRRQGAGYLAYALVDAVVDDYLPVADHLGECFENLEERVIDAPAPILVKEISELRGDLLAMRRDVWPMREALHQLLREDFETISEPVRVYLRDVHDHCVQVAEMLEVYREMASELQNLYLTSIANRTNEVMKVLTVVSTIFIPLTFLVGVWGMNFRHMPELEFPWAYPAVWLAFLVLGAGLFVYFRRKGWIGADPPDGPDGPS